MATKYKTFEELIQGTVNMLSLVPGTSVQIYAEDRIGNIIQRQFDGLLDLIWWPQYMSWYTNVTLDGTTGYPTTNDFVGNDTARVIQRFEDIRYLTPANAQRDITELPMHVNPTLITGTQIKYVESAEADGYTFRVWPATANETLVAHCLKRPNDFNATDTVRFDPVLLEYAAAYEVAEDTGTNPGQIQKFQNKYEARLNHWLSKLAEKPKPLDSRATQTQNDWTYGYR